MTCEEIIKSARTYRACADGCRAGAGRVATTGPQCPTTSLQHATTAGNDRSATHDNEYGSLKKTADDGYAMPDNGYRVGRRRVLLGR